MSSDDDFTGSENNKQQQKKEVSEKKKEKHLSDAPPLEVFHEKYNPNMVRRFRGKRKSSSAIIKRSRVSRLKGKTKEDEVYRKCYETYKYNRKMVWYAMKLQKLCVLGKICLVRHDKEGYLRVKRALQRVGNKMMTLVKSRPKPLNAK